MFGIGMSEMILICALALIVVGPDKLPELARSIAKGVMELKKTASGLKESLTDELGPAIDSVKPELQEASKALHENLEQQKRLSSPPTNITDDPSSGQSPVDATETDEQSNIVNNSNNSDVQTEPAQPVMTTDELIARAQKSKVNNQAEDTDA